LFLRETVRKKTVALVLTILAVIILIGGLFAFYSFYRQKSYPLNLSLNVGNGNGFLDGITSGHGPIAQLQVFVTSQHASGSSMSLSEAINAATWNGTIRGNGTITNSRYTVGQAIIVYRVYQDGYTETTNGSILLTQQMLASEIAMPVPVLRGESVTIRLVFLIPVQQWVPL